MNVSVIAGNYYNSNDGIGRYTSNLINELKLLDKNINLEIISQNSTVFSNKEKKKLNTSFIPSNIKSIIKPLEMEVRYFSRFKNNNQLLTCLLKDSNSHIYHAVSPSEAIAPIKLNKRPLITTFHDVIPLVSKPRFLLEKVYFNYYVNSAKKSDIILADSINTKRDLTTILNIPADKIVVVYPGIDTSKFYNIPKKKFTVKTILYQGGLVKRKGVYETLYAFDKLLTIRRDVRLLIGGGGEEEINLIKEVNRLKIGDYVTFLGFIDENKMVDTYNMADLFVYPSKYEGFGYTPLEAMACGVPVITSNSSSIPEVVGDAAVIVNPNDINELCLKMNMILDDFKLQIRMRDKGIIQARKFNKERTAKEILEIYKSLT